MPKSSAKFDICLEAGAKRVLASALGWPGWARGGRDRAAALQALVDYGPRYARVLRGTRLGFHAPAAASAFAVVEILKGNATTDYGVPGLPASADARPVDEAELRRLQAILKACWRAFDRAAEAAEGRKLSVGPRGGGRNLDKMKEHVQGAEASYLSQLGGKLSLAEDEPLDEKLRLTQQAVLKALPAAARGEFPARGPRGGLRWSPRYFVRRAAWHVLDHAWELEDRLV
jgi:hypothetical protein